MVMVHAGLLFVCFGCLLVALLVAAVELQFWIG